MLNSFKMPLNRDPFDPWNPWDNYNDEEDGEESPFQTLTKLQILKLVYIKEFESPSNWWQPTTTSPFWGPAFPTFPTMRIKSSTFKGNHL